METPSRHACPQTDKQRVQRERKIEACGGARHGWLGVMDGNMHGDASEKAGVKDKTRVK